MINQSIIIILVIAAVATFAVATATKTAVKLSEREMKDGYVEVNGYLAKKLPGKVDKIQLSMEKLASKVKRPDMFGLLKKKKSNKFVQAASNILKLKIMEGSSKCTEVAFEILAENDRLTGGRARDSLATTKRNHVEEIVRYYSLKHAQECTTTHIISYKLGLQRVNAMAVTLVESIMNQIIFYRLCGLVPSHENLDDCNPSNEKLNAQLPSIRSLEASDAPMIFEKLDSEARGTANEHLFRNVIEDPRSIRPDSFIDGVAEFIVNSALGKHCKEYIDVLGPKVFNQVEYDDTLIATPSITDSSASLYIGLANYRLCRSLLAEPKLISKDIYDYLISHYHHQNFDRVSRGETRVKPHHPSLGAYPPSY